MKRILMTILLVAAAALVTVALYAAPRTGKKTSFRQITVAVQGFHCQACPDELQRDLAKLPGVAEVNATLTPAQVTAKIDESKITASEFVSAIASHPQAMDTNKTYGARLVLYVDTQMCAANAKMCDACFTEIPKVLKSIDGVSTVSMDATGKIATVGFAKGAKVSTQDLAKALANSPFKFAMSLTAPKPATKTTSAGATCH